MPEAAALSIGVVYSGKSSQYHFGTVAKGATIAPTSQTLYELGSITKVFASTLLAQAVLENKVSLNDDIRKYLPGSYPNLTFQDQPIRLVHLANLTSGLPNWIPDAGVLFQSLTPDSIPYALLKQHKNFTKQQFYEKLHEVKLATPPGTSPKHSNAAAQLLGFILEDVYHRSFGELVKKYITGPLKMNQTMLHPVSSKQLITGYNDKGKAMPYITTPDFISSSELVSSTTDMIKLLRFELDTSNKVAQMTQEATVFDNRDTVALNWHIVGAGKSQYLWHTGGTFGFSSYIIIVPDQRLGMIFMANESDPNTQTKLANMAAKVVEYINANSKR